MPTRSPQIPASLIDDYGDVSKLRDEFAPTERLYQKLRKELNDHLSDAPANQEYVQCGERWTLDISERKMERTVDVKKAQKRLGPRNFLHVCSVTLKALEQYLLKPEIDALTVSEQTGARTFTLNPK